MILKWVEHFWKTINGIHPETRSLIIFFLFGYIMYSQIDWSTRKSIAEQYFHVTKCEKEAEEYTKITASEVNRHIRLIAQKDDEAFDVLLLSYHNTKQSLQGYKFLYLSCITESPKSVDTPLMASYWNNMDYIYYVDELERLHNQEIVHISDIERMRSIFPKLYRLVKSSDAKAVSFYVIEGKNSPIGMVVLLYKEAPSDQLEKAKIIMPSIQKLAILLDYENK